jgi:hypothetical protein
MARRVYTDFVTNRGATTPQRRSAPVQQRPYAQQPKENQATVPVHKKETGRKREVTLRLPGWRLLVIGFVVVCALVGAFLIFNQHLHSDPLPKSVKEQAHFPLYYPTKVPPKFRFDSAAYDASANVVTYDYSTPDGGKIFFSLQPKPSNFNFDDFRKKQLSGAHQVSIPLGTATIGVLQGQTVSSVVTDKTWILIGSGEKVSIDQLEKVSQSLAKAN